MLLIALRDYILRKLDRTPFSLGENINFNSHHETMDSLSSSNAKISIIIPTRDKTQLLNRCVESIRQLINDPNIELIIVDNKSKEIATKEYFDKLKQQGVTVMSYSKRFNFSKICNIAAKKATGEYLCFMNNDIEALETKWLYSMVEHASQPSVGLVGAILTFPNGTIQHMGVALGFTGVAGHPGRGEDPQALVPDNCFQVSAVTFACAVISANKYESLSGLDEDFPVAFNDVDFSIRATNSNFENVICTHARLTHGESQTRSRTLSLNGFFRGVGDVLLLLKKHNRSLSENYFVRRVLPNKL
jgi:GT2 family glycosyltransferase